MAYAGPACQRSRCSDKEMCHVKKKSTCYSADSDARQAVVVSPSVMPRQRRQITHSPSQALANVSVSEYTTLRTMIKPICTVISKRDSQTASRNRFWRFASLSPSEAVWHLV